MHRLSDSLPSASSAQILDSFKPSPRFSEVRFSNYEPDAKYPSQAAALNLVEQFAVKVPAKRNFFKRNTDPAPPGIYLDGGFGVGKTHLLTALWHEFSGTKVIASFSQYTSLVGALGFAQTVEVLSNFELLCIDEFELDDPGDTVLISTLLNRLVERGVKLAATSNTLPGQLGEGRFAADDFIREIQGLAAHFAIVRIDGGDYRHRENQSPRVFSCAELTEANELSETTAVETFSDLLAHLARLHPSSYHLLLMPFTQVNITDAFIIDDQAQALRFVVLVDRLYDQMIPTAICGVELGEIFSPTLIKSGYRKKYLRAISRLTALSNEVID